MSILSLNAQGQFWNWALVATGVVVVLMLAGYVLVRVARSYFQAGLEEHLSSDRLFARLAPMLERAGLMRDEDASDVKALLAEGTKTVSAAWASFVAIGHVLALAGGLVAMAQVVAAYRQVERLDTQNELLRFQNAELLATKESDLFIA